MGLITGLATLLLLSAPADARDAPDTRERPLRMSLVVGWGSSVGGLGGSVEAYVAGSRLSLFGGLGYMPSTHGGRGTPGPAFALGARAFTAGLRHRGFVEGAFSILKVEVAPEGSGAQGDDMFYGPSLSVGYQLVASSGVTFEVSVGYGRTLTGPEHARHNSFVSTIAVGYSWRGRERLR